ncbi:hypothetical protein J6A34_04635 [bacterium]|nr:hypothetical protein [bacterium]
MVMKSNYRVLSIAALAGLASLGVTNSVQAQGYDVLTEPQSINVQMPTPTLGDNAGYVLSEELTKATEISLTYYSVENGVIVPHYYEYSIKSGAGVDTNLVIDNKNYTQYYTIERDFINAMKVTVDSNGNESATSPLYNDIASPSGMSGGYNVDEEYLPDFKGDFINNIGDKKGNTPLLRGSFNSVETTLIGNQASLFSESEIKSLKVNAFNNHAPMSAIGTDMIGMLLGGSSISEIHDSVFINNSNKGLVESLSSESGGLTPDADALFHGDRLIDNFEYSLGNKSGADFDGLMSVLPPVMQPVIPGGVLTIGNSKVSNSLFVGNSSEFNAGALNVSGGLLSMADAMKIQPVKITVTDDNGNVLDTGYAFKQVADGLLSANDLYATSSDEIFVDSIDMVSMIGVSKDCIKYELIEETLTLSELNEAFQLKNNDKLTEETVKDYLLDDYKTELNEIENHLKDPEDAIPTVTNSSFLNNTAGTVVNGNGGAIYASTDLKVVANNSKDVVFKGNVAIRDGKKVSNAIFMDSRNDDTLQVLFLAINGDGQIPEGVDKMLLASPTTLSLVAENGGRIFMYDKISGRNGALYVKNKDSENQANSIQPYESTEPPKLVTSLDSSVHYNIDFKGDETGHIYLLNDVENEPNVGLFRTNLHLGRENVLDGSRLSLNSGNLYTINNQIGTMNLGSLSVVGDTNLLVDVDLKNQTMDRFTASEYGSHSGNLNVTGMNLLSDAVSDKTSILFAEKGLKDNVTYGGTELPDGKYQTTAYTPIYKYNVAYDNRDAAGYFVFTKGGKVGGSDSFNPAVLGSSTSATVGATATMNQTMNYAFQHSSDHMNIPYLERISMRDRNKYALSLTGDATDVGRYSPLFQPAAEQGGVWVKPYATFETVGLKNGPKVHNNTYGTLIGFDTEMQSIKRGWDRVFTGYIGYNGASQRYSGIDSTQNGGLLGGTMTLYKGNFFNATTVSVGASVANNQTMYGNEDFAMLLSGIGNKTGYNFEF